MVYAQYAEYVIIKILKLNSMETMSMSSQCDLFLLILRIFEYGMKVHVGLSVISDFNDKRFFLLNILVCVLLWNSLNRLNGVS